MRWSSVVRLRRSVPIACLVIVGLLGGGCEASGSPSSTSAYDLLYSAGPDGNADVYLVHMDGTGGGPTDHLDRQRVLGDDVSGWIQGPFHKLADQPREIYQMNPDGTAQVALTADANNLLVANLLLRHGPRMVARLPSS